MRSVRGLLHATQISHAVSKHAELRAHLVALLSGGGAHLDFSRAFANLPAELRGVQPPGIPYSPWQLLEHMRIAQWDILAFSRDATHVSPQWPEGYWPPSVVPPDAEAWDRSQASFLSDLEAMQALIRDPAHDLFAPLRHGQGQTLLREALVLADHNAYHLGQVVVVRRALGAWSE